MHTPDVTPHSPLCRTHGLWSTNVNAGAYKNCPLKPHGRLVKIPQSKGPLYTSGGDSK